MNKKIERERKFLVDSSKINKKDIIKTEFIIQGYLMLTDGKQLRVRLVEMERAYLTYKSDINNTDRNEFEYEIPYADGEALYLQCEISLTKSRRTMNYKGNEVVIDTYAHVPMVCEIEYTTEKLEPEFIPDFCTVDVTDDKYFSNINIAHLSTSKYKKS